MKRELTLSEPWEQEKKKHDQKQKEQNAQNARQFIEAIQTIASKPQNLDNLECYLTHHFPAWLEKFANTPEKITAELKAFAEMEV